MANTSGERSKTILVADDCDIVLDVLVATLNTFVVLHADSGTNALKVASSYTGHIDLLLAAVQMHGVSGRVLAETLTTFRPDMRVMLMSSGSCGDLRVLNHGWALIEKPFVPVKLLQMINDVLHTADRQQSNHVYLTRKAAGQE